MNFRATLQAIRYLLAPQRPGVWSQSVMTRSGRFIADRHRRLGNFENTVVELDVAINKEKLAREIIFDPKTPSGIFFEVGGRDGKLDYLLGMRGNFDFDKDLYQKSREQFEEKFKYLGNDLAPSAGTDLVVGDLCSESFLNDSRVAENSAAVVYSNNVFEHLKRPWIAAANIYRCLQPGGVGITIVPFSQRYHESPGDYFRYSHTGIASLFEDTGPIETIAAGYDILGRRNDWQGSGKAKDIVPVDAFGAWRETWFAFHAFRKPVT